MDSNALKRLYRVLTSLGVLLGSSVAIFAVLRVAPGAVWSTLPEIVERLPATIELAFVAFVVSVAVGAIIGFARARARAPALRSVFAVVSLVCRAIPIVVLAQLFPLLVMFTTRLPLAGMASSDAFDLRDRLAHMVEPVLMFALPFGGWSSSIFFDFFRASNGGSRTSIRRIAGTVAMTAALIGPALLSTSVFVEAAVAWPGVARLFLNAVSQRDAALIGGILLVYSVAIVLIKLCSEFAPAVAPVPTSGAKRLSAVGILGLVVLAMAAFAAIMASVIGPDPDTIDQVHFFGYPLAPGVGGHLLGTDDSGRDLLARLLSGLRRSLGIAALAALVAAAIGAFVAWATKRVRWFDERGVLIVIGIRPFVAFPFILAALALLVPRSQAHAVVSPIPIAFAIAAVSWPAIVPAFRTLTSATLGGVADLAGAALLLEFTLSTIGFGVQPPAASLGNMLRNAQFNAFAAPWAVAIPIAVLVLTLCALYALGDELRERPDVLRHDTR